MYREQSKHFDYDHTFYTRDRQKITVQYKVTICGVGTTRWDSVFCLPLDQVFRSLPYNQGLRPASWREFETAYRKPEYTTRIRSGQYTKWQVETNDVIYREVYIREVIHKTLILGQLLHKEIAQLIGGLHHWLTTEVAIYRRRGTQDLYENMTAQPRKYVR